MNTTKDKMRSVQVFTPSINILRDYKKPLNYIVTSNSKEVFNQIVNNYKTGSRSFNIVGAYGTGKSAFLLALEKTISSKQSYFSNTSFAKTSDFEIINIVGEHESFMETFASEVGLKKITKLRSKDIFTKLNEYYYELQKKNVGLIIAVDEFGKFLEFAAKNNPESELYFIQQLAEYANDLSKDILFISTLHQDFNEYSRELTKPQKHEWDKVRGRLKEITFNEPVEQLLLLASAQISTLSFSNTNKDFQKLFKTIEKSKAFPLKDFFTVEYAEKLLPFDILSASILTLSLQRYGQNERSLFSFFHSNDSLGLFNFNKKLNPYYNISCVYDYLIHNFYSLLTTKFNRDYAQWASIRTAIERVEGTLSSRISDGVKIIKVIGLLNIFSSASIKLDTEFLKSYCLYSLGIRDCEQIIKTLEGLRIIRFIKHSNKYILFEGTDLDIELAINEAGELVEKVTNVVHHLTQYFDFPYLSAKAIHFEYGTPRFFGFILSESPIDISPEGEIDGYINLVFSDQIGNEDMLTASRNCNGAVLYGWYKNNNEIRNLLFEIDKINRVKENHFDDKVALRELESILQHQVRLLNHYVIGSLYKSTSYLNWYFNGEEQTITDRRSFNQLLSTICRHIYHRTPVYKNEMVNKTRLSGPIQTAKKYFLKALVENWDKKDLGFDGNKFPPEKTIYRSLLRETGIHRVYKNEYFLGEPTNEQSRLSFLWKECSDFLESTFNGRRNLKELTDILLTHPYKLKQGFIDFWLPIFLFIKRDDFALFGRNGYIPFMTQENLELLSKDPRDYEIKAFHIEGVRLNLFNGYRLLLNQSTQQKLTNTIFIDTIRPFLTFYKKLPDYAKNTIRLDKRTLALRNAIATAKDPEDSFFIQFPKALGYDINELEKNPKLLKEYSITFQSSIKEIRQCYDQLVIRLEDFITKNIIGYDIKFPKYRTLLQKRYAHLKKYLLLPYQRSFYQRLYSETNEKAAWLNSVTQACIDKPLESIDDTEEKVLFEKITDIFHELDNLTEISESGFDIEKEFAFKFEITSFVEGLKKNLVRLPKSKTKQLIQLHSVIKAKLSDDKQLNIATLAKMLEELLEK